MSYTCESNKKQLVPDQEYKIIYLKQVLSYNNLDRRNGKKKNYHDEKRIFLRSSSITYKALKLDF